MVLSDFISVIYINATIDRIQIINKIFYFSSLQVSLLHLIGNLLFEGSGRIGNKILIDT